MCVSLDAEWNVNVAHEPMASPAASRTNSYRACSVMEAAPYAVCRAPGNAEGNINAKTTETPVSTNRKPPKMASDHSRRFGTVRGNMHDAAPSTFSRAISVWTAVRVCRTTSGELSRKIGNTASDTKPTMTK